MKNTIKKIIVLTVLVATYNQLHSLGGFIGDTLAGVSNVAASAAEVPGRAVNKVGRVVSGDDFYDRRYNNYWYNANSPAFYNPNERPYFMDADEIDIRRY